MISIFITKAKKALCDIETGFNQSSGLLSAIINTIFHPPNTVLSFICRSLFIKFLSDNFTILTVFFTILAILTNWQV
jgi:hypothetical protein